MSNEEDKLKHSRRLHNDERIIDKQVKIAKTHGIVVDEPHKYVKHHVTNCGNPSCVLCMNPRKYGKKTIQELRNEQDLNRPVDLCDEEFEQIVKPSGDNNE